MARKKNKKNEQEPISAAESAGELPRPDNGAAADDLAASNGADTATLHILEEPEVRAAPENAIVDADGETIVSLNRLAEDLQILQSSWADVEARLGAKDEEIAALAEDRQMHIAAFRSLQTELEEQLEENDSLSEQLDKTDRKLNDAEAEIQRHSKLVSEKEAELAERQAALEKLTEEREEAKRENQRLVEAMAAKAAEYESFDDEREKLGNQVKALKTELQSLEAYIDRRKVDWESQATELRQYKDAIAGMETSMRAKDESLAERMSEEKRLQTRLRELEKAKSALETEKSREEATNRKLNEQLEEKSTELESLTEKIEELRARKREAAGEAEDQKKEIDTLKGRIADLEQTLAEERASAESDRKAIKEGANRQFEDASRELQAARDEVNRLEEAGKGQRAEVAQLRGDLEEHEKAIEQLQDANSRLEERIEREAGVARELRAELRGLQGDKQSLQFEFDEFRKKAGGEIEKKQARIAELEDELERRNAAVELLNRNAQKLGMIKENVRKLDERLALQKAASSSVEPAPKPIPASGDTEFSTKANRLMVAVRGMPNIKFPIYKQSMTIGRSRENDIQVRRRFISRQHARLVDQADGTMIEDLGSKNGIFVNDQAVQESTYLKDGDLIDIGEIQFRFVELSEEDAAAQAANQN